MVKEGHSCPHCGGLVYKYMNPFPTVDIVIELEDKGIVLIQRGKEPYGWALPGGFGAFIQYVIAQMIGAFLGAVLVWLAYYEHFKATENKDLKLAVFCTGPAIRNYGWNLITEIIGTAMLLIGVLGIIASQNNLAGGIAPYAIGILVFSIGLSLGGPTGYAINPARDLGPRIAHFVLPIPDKRDSDWGYSWVPVVGPLIGGALGAWVYQLFVTTMLASYIQSLGG